MIKTKSSLIVALIFPIFFLAALTIYKHINLSKGSEVILPISGYDPRDLLSGHYLVYRINYGVETLCPSPTQRITGYVCFEPKKFTYSIPENCSKYIRGTCTYGRFEAGVEKFFVPEEKAIILERLIRSNFASIVLSISTDGSAQVKNLLINGKSWETQ